MFEKYNEKARRALFFARYEASKLGSKVIESEHLLLGILREGEDIIKEIFARFNVKPEEVRREIEGDRIFVERISSTAELPLSEESKKILAYASHEAESMMHPYVGTEHLLISLLRQNGSLAIVADAASPEGLEAAGIQRAIAVVIAISDPDGTRRIVRLCRHENPDVHIIVRTRYVSQVDPLKKLGADEVIPEEFETSVEIVSRLMNLLAVPGNVIALDADPLRDPSVLWGDPNRRAVFQGGTRMAEHSARLALLMSGQRRV